MLLLKPENVMKSSEVIKNHMTKCQARKRALECVYQSQEHRMADSKYANNNIKIAV